MDYRGTERADVLTGGADNDVIYGFGGNDTLKGGAGDDVLAGNDGNDILSGGDGDDYILGGAGNDTIDGGAGNDWAAYEDATAGVKVDLNITGTQNTGGSGTDKLTGIENLYGSAFDDTLIGDANDNMMVGDAGNDTLTGGKGNDTLWGSAGNDILDGGDGDDYLVGGAGDDVIKGGAGVDWASYEDATAGVKVDLTKTAMQDTVGAGKDTLTGVENLWGSQFDDVLTGDAKDNYLWGADGNDTLYGGAGDDHLSGGKGNNVIDGGDGFDTVDYSSSEQGVVVSLLSNGTSGFGLDRDIIRSVEAVMGSAYGDYIVGNAAENYLFGDAGDDQIYAVGDNDTIDGGDGDDFIYGGGANFGQNTGGLLIGGKGNDSFFVGPGHTTIDGGEGVDTLYVYPSADNVRTPLTIDLRITSEQQVSKEIYLTLSGVENINGGGGDDVLIGNASDNVLSGSYGNDTLDGGAGNDTVSYAYGPSGAVVIDLNKTVQAANGDHGTDTLISIENVIGSSGADRITGNSVANKLDGGAGNDILMGQGGDDTLTGGLGDDILDGGAGNDTAVYTGASKDYTWTRDANGVWTVRGADGVDKLLNVETLKFSDKSVTLSPSATTVTVDDLTKSKTLATSAGGLIRDTVLSSDGHTAYVSDGDGYVATIDILTGVVQGKVKVGTQLGGMDVSKDGRYLVIAERAVTNETGDTWATLKATATVHVLDLKTGVVKNYTTVALEGDKGFTDAVFTSDGRILLTQDFGGSGSTPLTILDPTSGVFAPQAKDYSASGYLSVSDDRTKVLLAPDGTSDAPLYIWSVGQGETAAHGRYDDGVMGFNGGIQAISGNGAFVAQAVNELNVFDGSLKHLANLTVGNREISNVYGMDFSADGKHLFVVDAVTDRVFQFSTANWEIERVLDLGIDIVSKGYVYENGMFGDRVAITPEGDRLVIANSYEVISVVMSSLTVEQGTGGADNIIGTAGADKLQGFGGDDVITGGKGSDIMTGGLGSDTFVFAKGDTTWVAGSYASIDVITDWQATDKLSFGPHSEAITYAEIKDTVYGYSWSGAFEAATKIMAEQHLSYLAVETDDSVVYVFAAESGSTNGTIESVVRLNNTTLDQISLDNFTPVGDDRANVLIGGALNDKIFGYSGNDVITGGKGADTLSGGAGDDTFVFAAGDTTWSATSDAGVDVITDWEVGDKLSFGALSAASLGKQTAANWQDAVTLAPQVMAAQGLTQLAVQVGKDTYVFSLQPGSTTGQIETVVKLANTTSDKVSLSNIDWTPPAINGDDGANTLVGGAGNDRIDGKGGADVIIGGPGNDILTGGAGADVFKFLANDGAFSPSLKNFDTITDFSAGDKLAFSNASALIKESDILRLNLGVNPDGSIPAVSQLVIEAYSNQYLSGGIGQKYLVIAAGADTYVVADNDTVHVGYDQVVLLKGVTSSLVTADMFTAA